MSACEIRVTGEDGRFVFDNVSDGRYVLVASFAGFADRRVAIIAGGSSRPLDIRLDPTPVQAEVTLTVRVNGRDIDPRASSTAVTRASRDGKYW